jgi:hypothetical protein
MDLQSPESEGLAVSPKLSSHSAKDSHWVGVETIGPITEDGGPMTAAAASARMEFAPSSDGMCPKFTLTTAPTGTDGLITITGAASNWLFAIPKQILPLPVGLWYWTFRVTDVNAMTRVIYKGTILITV